MITDKQNKEIKAMHVGFVAEVQAYKDALTAAGLPLSATAEALATAYRTKLFTPLLSDKGLKARWDLTKTDNAKVALINATIDIDGHDELTELQTMQDALRAKYRGVVNNSGHVLDNCSFEQFAQIYQLDLHRAVDAVTINLTDKQDIFAFFASLADTFGTARDILIAAGYLSTDAGLRDVVAMLERSYENQNWKCPLSVKDMAVWTLANELTSKGKRGIVPKA